MVYDGYSSSVEDFLNKDKSVTIHHRNLHQMAIEIFKVKIGIAPIAITKYLRLSKAILIT